MNQLQLTSTILHCQTMETLIMENQITTEQFNGVLSMMSKLILDFSIFSRRELTGLDADGIQRMKAFLNSGESHLLVVAKFAIHLKQLSIVQLHSSLQS